MPIPVVSCYTYRTSVDSPWTDAHHSVDQFVDAIKEHQVNGYGHVLANGVLPKRRISATNAHEPREWFGEMGGRLLTSGRRNRATTGRPGWRMRSSDTSQSSATVFERAVQLGKGVKPSSRVTY